MSAVLVGSVGTEQGAGAAPSTTQTVLTLDLRPRHPALLERLAAASSARQPLSASAIARLFSPTAAQLARVRRAMAAEGFHELARSGLSMSFAGPSAATAAAAGAARAPSGLGGAVQDVEGLSGAVRLRPLATAHPALVQPSCPGPRRVQSSAGGYLPAQLGAAAAYGHNALIAGGSDGHGERMAFVEFSAYDPADVASYQSCFGLTVPVTDVPVAGGTSARFAALEPTLDLEVALSAAPGLDHAYVYTAPPTYSMAGVLNQIVADQPSTGVHVVSVSWGQCEQLLAPARIAATNAALQLAAVAGITVVAASGDLGSLDCFGFPPATVDDPAAQPFATGVGGTSLALGRSGAQRETVWNDVFGAGGGGISRIWAKPSWQTGPGVINAYSSGAPCARSPGVCREVPDVALNATSGGRGYIVHCRAGNCGGAGWLVAGGTSAAAPLLAGIVADANSYSRAHGGQRLGFANPFLYGLFRSHPGVFRDVTVGDNGPGSLRLYPASPGYDLATGLGSVHAAPLAQRLAATTASPPAITPTALTAEPAGPRTVSFGTVIRFHGRLTAGGAPLANVRVVLQGVDELGFREWRAVTDAAGNWSIPLGRALDRKTRWRVSYLGSETTAPALAPGSTVYVIPHIGIAAQLPVADGRLTARAGGRFLLRGRTSPNLSGRTLVAYRRPVGVAAWTAIGPETVVRSRVGRTVSLPSPGLYQLAWRFAGGPAGQWIGSTSPLLTVRVVAG